jgi:urease accessory protein
MGESSVPDDLALSRLLRLASPALPAGAFSYSQGLETAIAQGWLRDEAAITDWIQDVLEFNLARFDAPLLARLIHSWAGADLTEVGRWNEVLLAGRETAEFRAETSQMGYSLRALFNATGEFPLADLERLAQISSPGFPTVFAFAVCTWRIPVRSALVGYLFAWAENQVGAAVKSMRLGHVGAQRILSAVSLALPALLESALACEDDALSNFSPGLTIASCLHEVQDGRMFRS